MNYLRSIYWTITTITTVGYGDISSSTDVEIVFGIIIMLSGVGFYSFMIGSLSSFLSDMDTRAAEITAKLAAIELFSKEAHISKKDRRKMRQAIRFNAKKLGVMWNDKHSLMDEFPKDLKYRLAISMYEGKAFKNIMFQGRDISFIT